MEEVRRRLAVRRKSALEVPIIELSADLSAHSGSDNCFPPEIKSTARPHVGYRNCIAPPVLGGQRMGRSRSSTPPKRTSDAPPGSSRSASEIAESPEATRENCNIERVGELTPRCHPLSLLNAPRVIPIFSQV